MVLIPHAQADPLLPPPVVTAMPADGGTLVSWTLPTSNVQSISVKVYVDRTLSRDFTLPGDAVSYMDMHGDHGVLTYEVTYESQGHTSTAGMAATLGYPHCWDVVQLNPLKIKIECLIP